MDILDKAMQHLQEKKTELELAQNKSTSAIAQGEFQGQPIQAARGPWR